ncbi:hypothetical protein HC928_06475 [bacterium]|nr:hypothetical protein [bacterium]
MTSLLMRGLFDFVADGDLVVAGEGLGINPHSGIQVFLDEIGFGVTGQQFVP